jgi:hypothetical protein
MQEQMQGGLLGAAGMPAPAQNVGGLLGGGGQMPQAPQGGQGGQGQGLALAQQLAANPTFDNAMQVIGKLKEMGRPEAAQFEAAILAIGDDPAAIKDMAEKVIQHITGAQ